jgi:hypothetical protein
MEHAHDGYSATGDTRLHDARTGTWFQGQWPAILASTLAGFGTAVLLTTLGAAIGMSTGAAMVDEPFTSEAATGLGLGAIVWIAFTSIAVGAVAGTVLSRLARTDRVYSPWIFGTLSWAGGIALALFVASSGTGGLMGGLGSTGAVAASQLDTSDARAFDSRTNSARGESGALSTETRQDMQLAAEDAAAAATVAAWTSLAGMVVALLATIMAASMRKHVDVVETAPIRTAHPGTFVRA